MSKEVPSCCMENNVMVQDVLQKQLKSNRKTGEKGKIFKSNFIFIYFHCFSSSLQVAARSHLCHHLNVPIEHNRNRAGRSLHHVSSVYFNCKQKTMPPSPKCEFSLKSLENRLHQRFSISHKDFISKVLLVVFPPSSFVSQPLTYLVLGSLKFNYGQTKCQHDNFCAARAAVNPCRNYDSLFHSGPTNFSLFML